MGIADGVDNRLAMQELFAFLAEQFGIAKFVETGTYQGETARFASERFRHVITIEGAQHLYRVAQQQLRGCPNVTCLCGDSRDHLSRILRDLQGPILFWLDAHWSGGETFGEHAECPLIEELAAVYSRAADHFVVIDDARFFISLPPIPHDIRAWPTYLEIADTVQRQAPHTFITIYADAIVLAPEWASEKLIPFLRRPLPTKPKPRRALGWLSWKRAS